MEETIVMFLFCLRKQGTSPATVARYRGWLLRYAHYFRYCPVEETDWEDLSAYIACLRVQFAPDTVERHVRALRRFFRWCISEGILPDNLASAL